MDSVLKYLADKIDEDLNVWEKDVAIGKGIKDFSDYKFNCGIYTGLLRVKGYIVETAERMEEE